MKVWSGLFFTLYENHLLSLYFCIFRSSVKTFQKDHFHSAVRFFVENYDICWSSKKVWFKETQSSRLWPIQQFFETAGRSFNDLSPLLPQIFVWVLFFEKEAFELSVIPLLFQDKEIDIYIVMSHWHLRQMVHLPYVSTIHRHQHLYCLRLRLFDTFCFALSRRQEEVLWRIYCEPQRQEEAASVQSSVQRSNTGHKTSRVADSKFCWAKRKYCNNTNYTWQLHLRNAFELQCFAQYLHLEKQAGESRISEEVEAVLPSLESLPQLK